jgi:hypothetical protein
VTRARAVLLGAVLAAALAAALGAFASGRAPDVPPDPQEAVLDGCGRDYLAQTQKQIPTWVYVGDRYDPATGPPPAARLLSGVVSSRYLPDLASHPTEEDLPPIHRSYDVNFDVEPDRSGRDLMGGSAAQHTGNFAGTSPSTARIHVEREQAVFPSFAWPDPGDRVELLGSWVWDCGHWTPAGERTEIHSFRALWLDRRQAVRSPAGGSEGDLLLSNDKTYAGVEADCAHQAKGVVPVFQSCLLTEPERLDIGAEYNFKLRLPRRPSKHARLRVRVVDAGSSGARAQISTRFRNGVLTVRARVPSGTAPLLVAKRILVAWTSTPRPVHLRVRFMRLLVRRSMDPGCPDGRATCGSRETTHGEQISSPPGEWNVYVDAAGVWRMWGGGILRVSDGQVVRHGPTLDVYLPRGRPWRLFVFTRECDWGSLGNADGAANAMTPCPHSGEVGTFDGDDRPGYIVKRFGSPAASVGFHRARPSRRAITTCPAVNRLGCYELDYVVTRVGR